MSWLRKCPILTQVLSTISLVILRGYIRLLVEFYLYLFGVLFIFIWSGYIYIYIYIHTHTHIYIYIYIYMVNVVDFYDFSLTKN